MSAARTVPETHQQDAGDARDQMRRTGTVPLLRGAAARFRAAEGTSFARALGHSTLLTLVPAVIAVIGLVTTFDMPGLTRVLEDVATSLAPGPAGGILTEAVQQARPASGLVALLAGLAGMLFSGTVGITHLERAANRIYGVEEHRSPWRRLGLAFAFAATVEVMFIAALAVIVAGGSIGEGGAAAGTSIWTVVRWPVGVALVSVAMTVIFRVVPNRRQPHFSWLLSGTAVSVVLWVAATVSLGLVYEHGSVLGDAYGPLIGVIALLVWAYATGLALLFGLAFAAQLEAERGDESPSSDDP
jgi:YihY family inner membrane protein